MNRRRFLSAIGAGTATATAGCTEIATAEVRAAPVVLPDDVRRAFGARAEGRRAFTDAVAHTVAGVDLRATVTSHAAVYSLHADRGSIRFGDGRRGRRPPSGDDAVGGDYRTGTGARGNVDEGRFDSRTALATPLALGVLATPSATVATRELNPLARADLSAVVASESGRRLLREFGVDPARIVRPLEPIDAARVDGAVAPSGLAGAVTPANVVAAAGLVADANGEPSLLFANVVRASRGESGDDVVLAAGLQQRPVSRPTAGTLESRPLVGDEGWITPDGLATGRQLTAAFLPYLESVTDGWRPFGGDATVDPAIAPGEYVSDGEDPSPDLAVVLAAPDAPIGDWVVYGDETVADHNPDRDPTDPVVVVGFEHLLDAGWPSWDRAPAASLFDGAVSRRVKFHAFPRSRLARHLVSAGG